MISCLGASTHHLLMPRGPFQLSSVVTSPYSKTFFLEKVSGKSPESFPERLPIWVWSSKKSKSPTNSIDFTINYYLNHFVVTFYYFRNSNWKSANEGHIDFGDNLMLVTIFERC